MCGNRPIRFFEIHISFLVSPVIGRSLPISAPLYSSPFGRNSRLNSAGCGAGVRCPLGTPAPAYTLNKERKNPALTVNGPEFVAELSVLLFGRVS